MKRLPKKEQGQRLDAVSDARTGGLGKVSFTRGIEGPASAGRKKRMPGDRLLVAVSEELRKNGVEVGSFMEGCRVEVLYEEGRLTVVMEKERKRIDWTKPNPEVEKIKEQKRKAAAG